MARRGRLEDWMMDDELDDDETGATVMMDGARDPSSLFDDDADDEGETVVMGSDDARALMDEALLDVPLDWSEASEEGSEPAPVHHDEPDPQTTLAPGDAEPPARVSRFDPTLLALSVLAGLVSAGLILAFGVAVLGLLLI